MAPSTPTQLLPWTNADLEKLLLDFIDHGAETPKADCKAEIDTSTNDGKAELLKDISAIANTYGTEFNDYGFLIYGVTPKAITGVKVTPTDTDKLQSHIEQLLNMYISPMPQIYVIGFTAAQGEQWGVIVIPPRNMKPYMFVKDLQGAKRSRKRGEWFVRRGSTTDVGLPEDLAVITQRQMDLMLEPLRESARNLQLRVARTEDQYNSALFKLVENATPSERGTQASDDRSSLAETIGSTLTLSLPTRLKRRLRTPDDALVNELIAEAITLRDFLDGGNTKLSWAPQPTDIEAAANRESIEMLEEKARPLVGSIATIVLDDRNGDFTDAVFRVVKSLSRTGTPSGVSFNWIGPALRDYPLVLLLYTAFICGTYANNGKILNQLLDIPLRQRSGGGRDNIVNMFFNVRRAKDLFNTAFGGRWCEPVAMRIRQVLSDTIGAMLPGIPEPEYFFRGEFVLALTPIDRGLSEKTAVVHNPLAPLPGLYLYLTEANDVIRDFLSERQDWLATLYRNPLLDILRAFDSNWTKAVSSDCIATGLYGLTSSAIYNSTVRSGIQEEGLGPKSS